MKKKTRKVFGVGINDCKHEYTTRSQAKIAKGKEDINLIRDCKYYKRWVAMLERCYCPKFLSRHPAYTGTTCDPAWIRFSAFKDWMRMQDHEGNQLDKDILGGGRKHYSPETCCFVPQMLNCFVTDSAATRGEFMIGVSAFGAKYKAQCRNPIAGVGEYFGLYNTEMEAHLAWKSRKHEIACIIADSGLVKDERVNSRLRVMYR